MSKHLVVVESPAKARTLGQILGKDYAIKASMGHVRDLPERELGVDLENDFTPKYVTLSKKRKAVSDIKGAGVGVETVYLATDPDREGEAISWHIVQAAKLLKVPVKRVVFHEITKDAILEAFRHPRSIDMKLVDAQQARRILDRLVGYKLSPLLWKRVRPGLSAGRVQSVALKLVVDRETEISNFVSVEHWSIEAKLAKETSGSPSFKATLMRVIGGSKIKLENEGQAHALVGDIKNASYTVSAVNQKSSERQPAPPFITSTLQQEAWRKLRFSAKQTMVVAQQLYEGLPLGDEGNVGLITYMRTDSTRAAPSAITETRAFIEDRYGPDFLPSSPRRFTKKVKGAQEAHEAIRPTSVRREPAQLEAHLNREQLRLYTLVWQRMVASQMAAARIDTTTVDIEATQDQKSYLFRAKSSVTAFAGFLSLYQEGKDDDEDDKGLDPLPELVKGNPLVVLDLTSEQHFTQPPPRYTEATLVKALEELGIGRPSTYAPILSLIQDRGYVERDKGKLLPAELGTIVSGLLSEHFADIVNVGFTAQMEEKLDRIAAGEMEWVPMLRDFYGPFDALITKATTEMPKVTQTTDEICEECGQPMIIKWGRRGKFLSCSAFPECKFAKPIIVSSGVKCPNPDCDGELIERRSGKGKLFYGCSRYPACKSATWNKPLPHPCPQCGGLLTLSRKDTAKCSQCDYEGAGVPEE